MSKRLILCAFATLAIALMSLPILQAQTIPGRGRFRLISSYEDDPYVRESAVGRLDAARFGLDENGRPSLRGDRVWIEDEPKIYRQNPQTGEFKALAWNPWPAPMANIEGDFRFPDEERFPLFKVERDSDGKVVLRDGLQVWTPQDLRLGMNTAFAAANAARIAAESWAGRDIVWGVNGRLEINTHAFVDYNAFYSPSARMLFFGVLPFRLPGETQIKIYELATSWETAAHESGHALHHTLKPNANNSDLGLRTWGESFGDQMAMWTSLRNWERAQKLLAETGGNLNQSNALTRIGEAYAVFGGQGTSLRDAFHNKKVSDTTEQIHSRSETLAGAAYKIFLTIYDELKCEQGAEVALRQAGQIAGVFLMRAADYTPENQMTLEDVAKAYLKVDKELFGGRYHALLVSEFMRREIFDAESVSEWRAHEAATPQLWLHPRWPDHVIEQMEQANLDKLGIGTDFGLKLQSVTRVNHFRRGIVPAQTIVRVQLTRGRGEGATPLDNHGILVFGATGALTDYHAPLPSNDYASFSDASLQTQALTMIGQAKQLSLDERGVPLSLARRPDGQLTVEARVIRGEGLNAYMEVFTLDNPGGERREIVIPPAPPSKRIPIPDDIIN